MNPIIKALILFIMVTYSESGRIEEMLRAKLKTMSHKPKVFADDDYDDGMDGISFYDANILENIQAQIDNSASQATFTEKLKKLPAKALISLYNSVNELQSGMGKIFKERKLTEGSKQSLEAILGLFKDGYFNTKDLVFG